MRSIKKRLVVNFLYIIIITVVILEISLIGLVRHNYYKNLEDNLSNQIKVSSDLYFRYFSDATLHENVLNNVDTFWKQTSVQVEIIDTSGNILMDSIGVLPMDASKMEDVQKALEGQKGKWIGNVEYDRSKVMAISYPLKSGDEIVGVLRFIASLREINRDIQRIALVFIAFGGLVIGISSFFSLFLANSIVRPLKKVTASAERMASGDFGAESIEKSDDEIGKLSDTLNYMAREILKKEQLKNDFISSVSHELRTPLTSIKGWAVTLKDGFEDRDILMDGLDIIEKESDRLTYMVEELLDFSKFVSGKISLEKKPVEVTSLLEHIRKQLSPRAVREQIDFQVFWDSDFPLMYADDNRLKQVFINLLDNSFKFTPAGGTISLTGHYAEGSFFFSIKDTGCGIAQEELPKVKEKFYKGKSSKSQNGIGLSICDEIIKLMHGVLEIKSGIDQGTEVLIILPQQERD